jgi:maltoporin
VKPFSEKNTFGHSLFIANGIISFKVVRAKKENTDSSNKTLNSLERRKTGRKDIYDIHLIHVQQWKNTHTQCTVLFAIAKYKKQF